jgi:hypothetical protein
MEVKQVTDPQKQRKRNPALPPHLTKNLPLLSHGDKLKMEEAMGKNGFDPESTRAWLRQGILLREILGPPRALRPFRFRPFDRW